jgi:choline-phosphate cytidylyltransferase
MATPTTTTTANAPARVVVTFGTFDLLHVGHLNLLQRARKLGTRLVVGVSTDALNERKKARRPLFPQTARVRLLQALRCVDQVFLEESLEQKREYLLRHMADVLVMGDDWTGRFDQFRDVCEVVYLPRTEGVSTTKTIDAARAYSDVVSETSV